MLPTHEPAPPKKKGVGIYLLEETLLAAAAIARTEKVKSRNFLLANFLTFAVELWPLLRPMNGAIEALMASEGCSYAQAVARLVERGLRSRK